MCDYIMFLLFNKIFRGDKMGKKVIYNVPLLLFNYLKSGGHIDLDIQSLYNEYGYGYNSNLDAQLLRKLYEYNYSLDDPYLATGQSGYFDEQIRLKGLGNQKLDLQDIEDARFIADCFGNTKKYSGNTVPIFYATMLGTVEFGYATQSFPAGVFEDVFQCSPNHVWPIRPLVGELEKDFYLRLLEHQIDNSDVFPIEKKQEALLRGKRLIEKFCSKKSKIYLIKMSDVLDVKASFGDVLGLRDGGLDDSAAMDEISKLTSFKALMDSYYFTRYSMFNDPNMICECGVSFYGTIPFSLLKYIEVESKYNAMQRRALDLGYQKGDVIPNLFEDDFDKVAVL